MHKAALRQAHAMAALQGVVQAVGMPDLHPGERIPNGFVLATEGFVVPAAIGRDINCGVRLMRTNLHRHDLDLPTLLRQIASEIHLGSRTGSLELSDLELEQILLSGVQALPSIGERLGASHPLGLLGDPSYVQRESPFVEEQGSLPGDLNAIARSHGRTAKNQLGTLGDGNHFLEFQVVDRILDEGLAAALGITRGMVTIMIHTGSRGLGHEVGHHYMHVAAAFNHHGPTPVPDAYPLPLESTEGGQYLSAMNAAANFAFANRLVLGALTTFALREAHPDVSVDLVYDVAHNMAKRESHGGRDLIVHRKGATRAFPASLMGGTPFASIGQPVLIPGSMGTASYLLVGQEGNEGSLRSVNHGAGRVLSRSEALSTGKGRHRQGRRDTEGEERHFATISEREFERAMRGIEMVYADGRTIIGEAPQAYKDIDDVVEVATKAGLARGVARLRPIGVLKG